MEINKDNYFETIQKVGVENLSDILKKGYEFVSRVTKQGADWKSYQTHKKLIDLQFSTLGLWMDKVYLKKEKHIPKENKPLKKYEANAQKEKYHKPNKRKYVSEERNEHKVKQPKQNKKDRFEKPKVKSKGVELIIPEVSFIKRYALLHGKSRTADQVASFIRSLHKAMDELRIRKTSKYARTIIEMQKDLIAKHHKAQKSKDRTVDFNFDTRTLNSLYKIAGAQVVMPSVRFIKAFHNMQGKDVTKEKAHNLLKRIEKAFETKTLTFKDKYYKHIRLVVNSLSEFLRNTESKSFKVSEAQLNGLECVLKDCGCNDLKGLELVTPKDDGVMTVQEARNLKFRPVELTGDWLQLIGKMCLPTHFLVYGLGGSGKTSFVLLFTQYLSKLGYKILYIAREQYNSPTFTDLLNRLNIEVGGNFEIVKDLSVRNPSNYDFVVLDSKDDMDIQLKHFKDLKEQYPNQSFIAISQGTKTGDFTGKGQWRNAVDVMVLAESGTIFTGQDKNRWGGSGQMRII